MVIRDGSSRFLGQPVTDGVAPVGNWSSDEIMKISAFSTPVIFLNYNLHASHTTALVSLLLSQTYLRCRSVSFIREICHHFMPFLSSADIWNLIQSKFD